MTDDSLTAKMVEKIRRLLKLAESPNIHEATAAAQKAQELLVKYNIDQAEVEAASGEKSPYGTKEEYPQGPGAYFTWKAHLAHQVARSTFCKAVRTTHKGAVPYVTFIGKQHNIEASVYLWTYLMREIERLALEAWRIVGQYEGKEVYNRRTRTMEWKDASRTTWVRDFCLAAARSVGERLAEQMEEQKADAGTMALIVVSQAELDAATRKAFPSLGSVHITFSTSTAAQRGTLAGRTIGLRQGVGAGAGGANRQIA